MSNEKSIIQNNAVAFSTVTFFAGLVVSGIAMFTFMESRIAKQVQETMRLTKVESDLKSHIAASAERAKAQKDSIWQYDQNARAFQESQSQRISALEKRVASAHSTSNQ